tara:strand:- start:420 stop:1787 length:1368 start_codon:yes stop_codon:yes gene_type:complete
LVIFLSHTACQHFGWVAILGAMERRFENFEEVRTYLYGLRSHGAKYGIDRMRALVEKLGYPEQRYPVVHVAGTNGKGSTVAMLESIFRSAGYRTGMFTSPHLIYQGERVQVDREILPHSEIVKMANGLAEVADKLAVEDPDLHPSFFEFMTAMAFDHFAFEDVDVALIETGLGGRLDATNVVEPALTIITSIGLDHMELLGDTLEEIAAEKAGILKAGVPVVMGWLPSEAEAVVRGRAVELGCEVFSIKERFGEAIEAYPQSALSGDFQRLNAGIATLVAERLQESFSRLSEAAIEEGLRSVVWAARWDQREISGRQLILDTTHNEEGTRFLAQQLQRLVDETGQRPIVALGAMGDERAQSLINCVAPYARELHLVRPKQPRACTFEAMEAMVPASFAGVVQRAEVNTLFPAPQTMTLGEVGDTVVVTGSIYLIGEVLDAMTSKVSRSEGDLQDF